MKPGFVLLTPGFCVLTINTRVFQMAVLVNSLTEYLYCIHMFVEYSSILFYCAKYGHITY